MKEERKRNSCSQWSRSVSLKALYAASRAKGCFMRNYEFSKRAKDMINIKYAKLVLTDMVM